MMLDLVTAPWDSAGELWPVREELGREWVVPPHPSRIHSTPCSSPCSVHIVPVSAGVLMTCQELGVCQKGDP